MLTMKEKVAKNYENYPLEERNHTVELEIEEDDYAKIEQCAKDNNISIEEFIFMALLERLDNENNYDDGPFSNNYDYSHNPFQVD